MRLVHGITMVKQTKRTTRHTPMQAKSVKKKVVKDHKKNRARNVKRDDHKVLKKTEVVVSVAVPPSLAQVTSLLSTIGKDTELLRTVKPRSRDARLLASGIARACEEIATRCRDFAGVDSSSGDVTVEVTKTDPAPAVTAPQIPTVTARLPSTPVIHPVRSITHAPVVVATPTKKDIDTGSTSAPRKEVQATTVAPTPSDNATTGVNHAIILAGRDETIEDVAGRLGKGVSCSYIGLAAQVRHIESRGFLSPGSHVIAVRDNGEVVGHLPWVETAPGTGEYAKTYFIFSNPTEAVAAVGKIDLRGVKIGTPIAVGPSVVNRGLEENNREKAAEYTAIRSAIGREAAAACGLS